MLTVTNLTSVDYLIRNLPLPEATMVGDIIAETLDVVNVFAEGSGEAIYTEDEITCWTLRGFEDFLFDLIDPRALNAEDFRADTDDENLIRYDRFVEILERLTYRDPSEIDWD
tara:strand:+ start:123 stop:461 length:339 start_codon:yes stop_codon:yes gene_type:complete